MEGAGDEEGVDLEGRLLEKMEGWGDKEGVDLEGL